MITLTNASHGGYTSHGCVSTAHATIVAQLAGYYNASQWQGKRTKPYGCGGNDYPYVYQVYTYIGTSPQRWRGLGTPRGALGLQVYVGSYSYETCLKYDETAIGLIPIY